MGLHQTKELLHSKGNSHQTQETVHKIGENLPVTHPIKEISIGNSKNSTPKETTPQ
jgi:hypothetical protein